MIDRLINKCVSAMVQRGVIADTEEQKEIYAYGLELKFYYIIHAALLLGIGALAGRALEVALLMFLFGLIQSYGGGYHAETHKRCMAFMVLGVLAFLALYPVYLVHVMLQGASVVLGLAIVLALAPIAHKNHPLSRPYSKKMGRKAKCIACLIAGLWCILFFSGAWPAGRGIIAIVMLFSGVSMVCAQLKQWGAFSFRRYRV